MIYPVNADAIGTAMYESEELFGKTTKEFYDFFIANFPQYMTLHATCTEEKMYGIDDVYHIILDINRYVDIDNSFETPIAHSRFHVIGVEGHGWFARDYDEDYVFQTNPLNHDHPSMSASEIFQRHCIY